MAYPLKKGSKEAYHFMVLRDVSSLGHRKAESALKVSVIEGSISPQLPASAFDRHSSMQHHLISHSQSSAWCCILSHVGDPCWCWATYIFLPFESFQGL